MPALPAGPRVNRNPVLAWKESELQQHVVSLARQLGWGSYHTHDSRRSQPGFPDLVLWHPAKDLILFRELKTETGRLSADQLNVLGQLEEAGADVAIWRPGHWADHSIQRHLMYGAPERKTTNHA